MAKSITLRLWVANRARYTAYTDPTFLYIEWTGWKPPEGVECNIQAKFNDDGEKPIFLSGPPEATWEAFKVLAKKVRQVRCFIDEWVKTYPEDKHGRRRNTQRPRLTACPTELLEHLTDKSVVVKSARDQSTKNMSWADYAKGCGIKTS